MERENERSENIFENITADMPVIGFTGALGSGCTYLSRGLADQFNYAYCSLSELIRYIVEQEELGETTNALQDKGNDLRRNHGRDILVRCALEGLEEEIPGMGAPNRPRGIVVDGIRNTGEVEALRQFANFFLFSIQASTNVRERRTIGKGKKFATAEEFSTADARDRDEEMDYGQQVKQCNYLADVIVLNEPEEEVSPDAQGPYETYVKEALHDRYVSLIEHICDGRLPNERMARQDEALMTAAYVESRRSSCLKRKVGAVIASAKGDIISAGHNDVPGATKPCIEDPEYGWCARDVIQEHLGQAMAHCPGCGRTIEIDTYSCKSCGQELTDFRKRCSNQDCRASVDVPYKCPQCDADVFQTFLPGGGSGGTGRLLDMCRSLHAEENAILNLCKVGGLLDGCVLYSTTFPCNLCANKIAAVGIGKVVYAEPYTMDEAKRVLDKEGVTHERFQGVKSRAYFRLYG